MERRRTSKSKASSCIFTTMMPDDLWPPPPREEDPEILELKDRGQPHGKCLTQHRECKHTALTESMQGPNSQGLLSQAPAAFPTGLPCCKPSPDSQSTCGFTGKFPACPQQAQVGKELVHRFTTEAKTTTIG